MSRVSWVRFSYYILFSLKHILSTNSVKHSDVAPYFIVLASSVKIKEVEVIEFHRIEEMEMCNTLGFV